MHAMTGLIPLTGIAPDLIELLLDAAFGQDRHGRTAYRLREGSSTIDPLSFAITDETTLIASIQCWPVRIGTCKLVLVGPVAVDPNRQNEGHGRRLMHAMLDVAAKMGDPPLVMIGDPEYYERFGFTADATARWTLPGPWEPRRLLARNVAEHRIPIKGMLERHDAL
jgi:predicted N-acetyltransferase YhbS